MALASESMDEMDVVHQNGDGKGHRKLEQRIDDINGKNEPTRLKLAQQIILLK